MQFCVEFVAAGSKYLLVNHFDTADVAVVEVEKQVDVPKVFGC